MPHAWRDAATGALASVILGAVILTAALMLLAELAYGRTQYPGQYAAYSDETRSWFKGVRSPRGVPCCNIADGHITRWRSGPSDDEYSGYEVPIEVAPEVRPCEPDDVACWGDLAPKPEIIWARVPKAAVIENAHKPDEVEESVVWYVRQEKRDYFIRCFVPGDGV